MPDSGALVLGIIEPACLVQAVRYPASAREGRPGLTISPLGCRRPDLLRRLCGALFAAYIPALERRMLMRGWLI